MADRKVVVLGTGGTVSTLGSSLYDVTPYPSGSTKLSAATTLDRVRTHVAEGISVEPEEYLAISSRDMSLDGWLHLASLVSDLRGRVASDGGIVVTHGTSTLEETAFFLSLGQRQPAPVVLVGAMRPLSVIGTDAERNLVDAIHVAASPDTRNFGAVAVLDGMIFDASGVRKIATHGTNAFAPGDEGILGYVNADGRVEVLSAPRRGISDPLRARLAKVTSLPRVEIVPSYAGADGAMIRAAVEAGAAAIISAGQSSGMVTSAELAAFADALDRGVHIIQSRRVAAGRVYPTEAHAKMDIVMAGRLDPFKARILTMAVLAAGGRRPELVAAFAAY